MDGPLRIEIPAKLAGTRFDHALNGLVPGHTRSQLQKLVRRGRVKLDGRKVLRSNIKLRGGETLLVHLEDPNATAPPLELEFVHVADAFAVVNKPPGMLTHPTETVTQGTVADLAQGRLGPLPTIEEMYRPGIVHRLDRETSGILVVARTDEALEDLRNQFRERSVEKRYLALVHGVPSKNDFEVGLSLASVPGQKDLQRVDPRGREALTRFEVLERFENHALVACHPKTGRRHQLRVHLHAAGHPIVGDKLYRPELPTTPLRVPHHILHAEGLAFDDPTNGERFAARADAPATFTSIIESLK